MAAEGFDIQSLKETGGDLRWNKEEAGENKRNKKDTYCMAEELL